ncbi:hypothetical protein D9758_003646 [Tetrapyrgos nigripes]|uniref:Choline/carnitine acyltransferase domain-containing protein n=1 Tax=Tetrapyrgos nigripes TaxID=182062 RepID=A0A8H5GM66_9AGAR|nr:hypothetical protein D9758_003646 [Tetrapyrgos nigripes]
MFARTRNRPIRNFCMSRHANSHLEQRKPVQLPRLPVPDLSKTLTKYLASLEPLLQEESLRTGVPYAQAYAFRAKWAEEFSHGVGKVCQERLKALDRASPNNWLDDNFWLKSYLDWRAPLVLNSNWWMIFCDDQHGSVPSAEPGFTNWQLRRTAWLTHRILELKDKIDNQEVYPDTSRTGIWFRESVYKIFNVCRIPRQISDTLSSPPPPDDILSQYVTVIANNWFYALRVYTRRFELIPASEILERMAAIARDAFVRGQGPMIGALSADDRDIWAKNLSHLLSLNPQNEKIHQAIVRSLFSVTLDSQTHALSESEAKSRSTSPVASTSQSQVSLDAHLHSVRSVPSNVSNRFFDKPITLIVDPSGQAGVMGEHSPCDALVPSMVGEYAVVQCVPDDFGVDTNVNAQAEAKDVDPQTRTEGDDWYRLDWITDSHVLSECVEAKKRAELVIADSDNSVLWFEDYGGDWIKSVGLSPDVFIQLAMQLAWFRTHPNENRFTATYETALTRLFHKGRTETIRTLTTDSRRWVLGMEDASMSPQAKHSLLFRAHRTHTTLTREAMTGRGIDRHLFGLRNMLTAKEQSGVNSDNQSNNSSGSGTGIELFTDPLFMKSADWRLSTSGLSAGLLFKGTGFGARCEDGYGINYLAGPSMIKFGIESKFSHHNTSTEGFKRAIVGALRDMHVLCVEVGVSDVRSKL